MVNRKIIIIAFVIVAIAVVTIGIVVGVVFGLKSDKTLVSPAKSGKIKGTLEKEAESEVFVYHNVPYAIPPVGNLRFQPPQICTTDNCWNGTYDASVSSDVKCVQSDSLDGIEDCLKLTIRTTDLTASKPVIVWIHGGGLIVGFNGAKGYSFDAELTSNLDAVTVNINYRLGYLGFSALEEFWDETSGVYANNGFRDMATALTWIKNNIASFGGNPDSVTLIGESGGGTAILGLISSPLANNLFHKAVSLSPAPEFRFDYTVGNDMQRFVVTEVGCTQSTLKERRTCLLETPAYKFSIVPSSSGAAYFDFPERYPKSSNAEYVGMVFTDPVVFPVNSRNLKDAKFTPNSKVKVIVSNLAHENSLMSIYGSEQHTFTNQTILNSTLTLLYKNVTLDADILDKTYEMYPDFSAQMIWDTLTSDMRSTCPTNDVAEAMSKSTNHEIYRLYITNSMANFPFYSAFHAWDTSALFGFSMDGFELYALGKSDIEFKNELRTMLKNFAHNGEVADGWNTFPSNAMVLGNDTPMIKITTTKPQEDQCTKLSNLDLVKYGWQN